MEIIKTEVKKLSLKNERLEATMEVDYRGKDPNNNEIETTDEVVRKSSQVVHADLKETLNRLRIHMVCICEQPEAGLLNDKNIFDFDPDQLENYEITGYSISGYDESRGVVITGKKLLKTGMVLNINTPFTKFEDEDGYKYGGALASDIEACNYEVEAHLNGKWGIVQQEFDFDTPAEADLNPGAGAAA